MGRKKTEIVDGKKQCNLCRTWKDVGEFRKSQGKCKSCQDRYQREYYDQNRAKRLEYARNYNKQRRIAKRFDYDYVLHEMVDGMVYRGSKKTGTYADVSCQWSSIPQAIQDLRNDARLIEAFDVQFLRYVKSHDPDDVPSIHRKDSSKGYYLDNISIIGWGEHKQVDICKAVDVMCWTDWTVKRISTMRAAKEQLGTLKILDKGLALNCEDGKTYVVQSATITDSKGRLVENRHQGMSNAEIVSIIKTKMEKSKKITESVKRMV